MVAKLVAALIAVALVFAYVGPMVIKMKDLPLAIVVLVGVAVMLADLWQSLRDSND